MSQRQNSIKNDAIGRPKSFKRSNSLNLHRDYEVLKPAEVVKMMDEETKKVQEVVNVS